MDFEIVVNILIGFMCFIFGFCLGSCNMISSSFIDYVKSEKYDDIKKENTELKATIKNMRKYK